jgi:HSP20 family protein
MAIVRWEPMWRWPRLFDEDWDLPEEIGRGLNVYETKDDVVVEACVPGIDPKDVEVEVEGDLITIRGEAKVEEKDEKKKTYYRKMEERSFDYVTTAPRPVKADKARAEVKDGVVTVTIPKAEEAKPKKVEVEVKG